MAIALANALTELGVPPESFVNFGEAPSARHLRYMDLLDAPRRAKQIHELPSPDGVVEASGKAAVYVLRESLLAGPASTEKLAQLMRTLACRADAAYLAVVAPGTTTVYKVGFYPGGVLPAIHSEIPATDPTGLRNLLNGPYPESKKCKADSFWLDDLLFRLLTDSATALRTACPKSKLSDGDVVSLIGRALFTRFLVDRGILPESEVSVVSTGASRPEELFSTETSLIQTFKWLDTTFNGDLLELRSKNYEGLLVELGAATKRVCEVLSNVMARAAGGQLSLDWGGLRFQHIPVDVLSQVYEHFAHRFMPVTARKTSIHYTPRAIAELLVDGVFGATPEGQRHSARVLDPAAGAGVFLVLAFRRLVAEHWLHVGRRPNRTEVRRILTEQLCGLDINPTAIKVAALSLYLAALELDPEPQPLSDLRFERLFDSTLRCVDEEHLQDVDDKELGSLSTRLRDLGPFDIVVANPPWTQLPGTFKKQLDRTAWIDGKAPAGYKESLVPNQWPDLAFLWCSTRWCKSGGVLGLLINARFLFSEETAKVRARWFSITRVTGVLNGMHLRNERKIWPTNTQPFCALVSINTAATPEDSFYFLSPRSEPALAQRREFRLDPRAATPVPVAMAMREPHALKTLARGSALDLDLLTRIRCSPRIPMRDYLKQKGFALHQGFITGERNQLDASALQNLPILEGTDRPKFAVRVNSLSPFASRYPELTAQWPRARSIYDGPHLLFREAPKQDPAGRGAILTDGTVAFSRSFYGITIPSRQTALRNYLYTLSYSDLLVYWTLMTSSKFGVERETFNIKDFENFPIPPWESLSLSVQEDIDRIAEKISNGDEPWQEVNALVARIYGLTRYDQALIDDALAFECPYSASQEAAVMPVERNGNAVVDFSSEIVEIISDVEDLPIVGQPYEFSTNDGAWQFIRLYESTRLPKAHEVPSTLLKHASDPLMTSEIRIQLGTNDWVIGRLRYQRYWTRSQARLLALDLMENGLFSNAAS